MPRSISKIKQAEAKIKARDEQIDNLENLVRALTVRELETMVSYREEQASFAKYKLSDAKENFAKGMEKGL